MLQLLLPFYRHLIFARCLTKLSCKLGMLPSSVSIQVETFSPPFNEHITYGTTVNISYLCELNPSKLNAQSAKSGRSNLAKKDRILKRLPPVFYHPSQRQILLSLLYFRSPVILLFAFSQPQFYLNQTVF